MQVFLIGIGAGAATALLFASVASGSPLSVLLFYLAPLPILLAALGWSHWAALIAALFASAGLAAVFSSYFFLAFLIGVGLPAWWLGYLALLARPVEGAPDGLEWYPVGHLVVWAAILGASVVIAGMLHFGTDEESFRASLRSFLERMLRGGARGDAAGRTAERRRIRPADRLSGGGAAADRRRRHHHHQPAQSLAREPHRADFRPPAPSCRPISRPCSFPPMRRR